MRSPPLSVHLVKVLLVVARVLLLARLLLLARRRGRVQEAGQSGGPVQRKLAVRVCIALLEARGGSVWDVGSGPCVKQSTVVNLISSARIGQQYTRGEPRFAIIRIHIKSLSIPPCQRTVSPS